VPESNSSWQHNEPLVRGEEAKRREKLGGKSYFLLNPYIDGSYRPNKI
jgi:hypothetical protein